MWDAVWDAVWDAKGGGPRSWPAGFTHMCRPGIHSRGPAGGLRAVQDHSAGLSSKAPPSRSTSSSLSLTRAPQRQ
jgi:hypothetical protein